MIQPQTIVKVTDNSGARVGRVFKVLGGTRKRYARIGDEVVVSIQIAEPRKLIKKKEIVRGVVVRQAAPFRRKDGSYIRFDENAIVIIDVKKEPKSTRVFGPVPRELEEKYKKICSLAKEVI